MGRIIINGRALTIKNRRRMERKSRRKEEFTRQYEVSGWGHHCEKFYSYSGNSVLGTRTKLRKDG